MFSRGLFSLRGGILGMTSRSLRAGHSHRPMCSSSGKPNIPEWTRGKKGDSDGPPVTWRALRSSGLILAALGGIYVILKNKKDKEIIRSRQRSVGKAAIGGDFELIDHRGKPVSNKDFKGHWMMLYFGFTHCPDICPDEMEKMAEVKDALVAKAKSDSIVDGEIVPLFISVDPARDGVKEVAEYIKEFHPEMIGLTGTLEAVTKAAKTYRVYFSAGPAEYENDYIVDHTIIMYLINPDGEFVDYYGQSKNKEHITGSIVKHMYKYQRLHAPSFLDQVTDFVFGPDDDEDNNP
eukprot:TRINITY_DN1589_c0_g1_i1.p1 TRINITY_DN1589_c0_g1~~TRINITY_DN1589_c0_g1_i1.p1  ORF type:complete len:303 (-),score=65.60 TRINITY_DN1589_c0_g1_i1:300-1175(-)